MKILLILMVLSSFSPALLPQDPPHPDAVAFCQHANEDDDATFCSCPTANDGNLCKSDEPYPAFCKKMCGHAKDCHCCGINK